MKTSAASTATLSAKLITTAALIMAAAAVQVAFHQGNIKASNTFLSPEMAVARVEIIGKRMSPQEKLAYDLAPQEIARVEIIGKRPGSDNMVAQTEKNTQLHRKA